MENRRRRYLGMTCGQIIVLAFLGLGALGGIGYAVKLILGNEIPLGVAPVPPSLEEPATLLPISTDTPFPNYTPVPPMPTFTVTTYASLIPQDWNQFKYDKVEMWMPADFVKKTLKDTLVYAENKNASGNGSVVSVGLTKDTPTVTDLDDYIREGVKQFTPDTTFLEKKKFEIGSYEAVRVKMQVIMLNVPMGEAFYFIQDGGTIWILTGLSHYDEFSNWLKTFDQIARNFRINH